MIRFFELDSRDMDIGVKLGALAIPATYSNGVFLPMAKRQDHFI